VLSNLDSIGEMVGSLMGMSQGLNESDYVDGLIRQAHGVASHEFDLAAVATAKTGHLQHVFEYGVPGVTQGTPVGVLPTAPEARLYEHVLVGGPETKDIAYVFRPATQRNPRPSTANTGIASKYVAKLSRRKYIFYNKAEVMESGRTIELHAKNGDALFVPFKGPSKNPNNRRGYMMWNTATQGPLKVTPGRTSKGEFTSFWFSWWSDSGAGILEEDMRATVLADIEKAILSAEMKSNAHRVKPLSQTSITATASRAAAGIKKFFINPRRNAIRTR